MSEAEIQERAYRQEIKAVVNEYTEIGCTVSDEDVSDIIKYCYRKMEVAKIKNTEEYLPLLFRDEIKNYLIRIYINATMMLSMELEGMLWQNKQVQV